MLSICLLISGGLGYEILKKITSTTDVKLNAVFTNKNSTEIIHLCKEKNIPVFIGNPRNGKATAFIETIKCDILLSVNYLYIIERDLINLPSKYAINIHGSLLPKYRGRTPHVWAIINGEKEAGITAHVIDEDVDNGGIIHQIVVPIEDNHTGAMILGEYNKKYPILVDMILEDLKNDTINIQEQDISKATYFGKRTPESGRIIWDWNRQRIRNWIRAQAKPYPGAFFYIDNHKVIVHKATYCDLGFHYEDKNGLVLSADKNNIIVKTPDGALRLENIEYGNLITKIQKGTILS